MIKCPECGKEISETAFACPYCGYTSNQPSTQQKKTNLIAFILGLVLCLVANRTENSIIMIVGFALEVIAALIAVVWTLMFDRRAIRIIFYIFIFDLGYALGVIFKFIFGW